mmetsp:Transcript_39402/g.81822  ORF Transcript_39402/g.81822 Transcript_39402/m.81822 type:complete len:548 (-) Transcript_39402:132-1775(-)
MYSNNNTNNNNHHTTSGLNGYQEDGWVNPHRGEDMTPSDLYSFLGHAGTTATANSSNQEEEDSILQQHLIEQEIALRQIQQQQQQQQLKKPPPPSLSYQEEIDAQATGLDALFFPESRSQLLAAPVSPPSSAGIQTRLVLEDPQGVDPKQSPVRGSGGSTNTATTTGTEEDLAVVQVAEERLAQGQCPSCGQQLYEMIVVDEKPNHNHNPKNNNRKWKTFWNFRSSSSGTTNSTQQQGETAGTGTPAPLPPQRQKPLHIPGVVHRGQCVACSQATHTPEQEEEEEVNPFLQEEEEDDYLHNSILNPLMPSEPRSGSTSPAPAVATYTGPLNDRGERHGLGTLQWSNGDVYKGNFCRGVRQGAGSLTFGNGGGEYVGDWRDNLMHGTGTRRFANGDLYTGPYVQGQRQGRQGRFYFTNGDLYVGDWHHNVMHGTGGRYYYHHGQRFEGDFVNGLRHGKGKLQRLDGSLDIFRYVQNERQGTGVRWSADRLSAWKLTLTTASSSHKVKAKKISIPQAVSLVYEIENALEAQTVTAHDSDLPTTQQGTTV